MFPNKSLKRHPMFPNLKPQNRRHPLSLKWNKKKIEKRRDYFKEH